jgi:heme oxygenase
MALPTPPSTAMSAPAACPLKQLASEDEALLDLLRRATACPYSKRTSSNSAEALESVLNSVPMDEYPHLMRLLQDKAALLQERLGIDGNSWDAVLLGHSASTSPSGTQKLDAAVPVPLSKRLKDGTKSVHAAAEKTDFVREFVKGRCDVACYRMMIKDLYFVYAALEAAAERCAANPLYSPLHFPAELGRTRALMADMHSLFGDTWRNDLQAQPSSAAQEYVARLEHIAEHEPELMAAHAYTRYLGDLSGGRVLARIARRILSLDPGCDDGVSFYTFERVPNPKTFKEHYRRNLDALPTSEDLTTRMVHEAVLAFELNIGLFKALDAYKAEHALVDAPAHQSDEGVARESDEGSSPNGVIPSRRSRATAAGTRTAERGESASSDVIMSEATRAVAAEAGCPFAKYAAASGTHGLKCQRFAVATAKRGRGRRAADAWLMLTLLVLALALVLALTVRSSNGDEHHAARGASRWTEAVTGGLGAGASFPCFAVLA